MKFEDFIKNAVVPLISVLTALMVAYLNYSVNDKNQKIQEDLERINGQVTLNKEEREERESKQEFNLKIYDIVIKSIEEKNAKKQEAASAFIVAMTEEPLRSRFLSVLKAGGEPEVQKNVSEILEAEQKFKESERSTTDVVVAQPSEDKIAPSYNWGEWDFDIFWCTTSGVVAKQQAEQISKQLLAEGATGRIRVRELPESINVKAGYQISGYGIRRNDNKNEKEAAEALQKLAEKVLEADGVKPSFNVSISYQNTPWYISSFVCPVNG